MGDKVEMLCGMFPDIEASVVAMVLESCDGDVSMAAVDLTNMQAINDAEQASKRAAEGGDGDGGADNGGDVIDDGGMDGAADDQLRQSGFFGDAPGNVTIVVASLKPTKVNNVLAVFEEWFFEDKCQAFGMSCDSGVISGQPFGQQGTFDAACFRLADIRRQGGVADEDHAGEADFHVAVENGVFTVLEVDETSAWDVCCVVVEEVATGLRAAGWSQARPFPLARTQAMREDHTGYEVGDYIADYYENVRPGFVLRSTQVTQATADALRQLCYKRSMETKLKGHTGAGTDDDGLF